MYNTDMNDTKSVDLTVAMLETLFRGRDLTTAQCHVLPNGEYLTGSDLKLLFESYVQ